MSIFSLSLFLAAMLALATALAQEEPVTADQHEFEELGVNRYTAPSIARIFKQLDELKPLPFDQLKRDLPQLIPADREQKGLIFGGLIADGFLLVAAERKNLIDNFGRILLQQARGLGVADRVTRHSASLTELGRRGEWPRMRAELIQTQTDVEQAMVELRDEKMAHLISLGGWLRGLEICANAIGSDFSPQRAKVLAEPDLAEYFATELNTLPPNVARRALFEKLRAGIKGLRALLSKPPQALTPTDLHTIQAQAHELNTAICQNK
jgi:hypothetical protein